MLNAGKVGRRHRQQDTAAGPNPLCFSPAQSNTEPTQQCNKSLQTRVLRLQHANGCAAEEEHWSSTQLGERPKRQRSCCSPLNGLWPSGWYVAPTSAATLASGPSMQRSSHSGNAVRSSADTCGRGRAGQQTGVKTWRCLYSLRTRRDTP